MEAKCVDGVDHLCIGASPKISGIADANQVRTLLTYGIRSVMSGKLDERLHESDIGKANTSKFSHSSESLSEWDRSELDEEDFQTDGMASARLS